MKLKTLTAGIIAASLLSACSSSSNNDGPKNTDVPYNTNVKNAKRVLNTNADIAYSAYFDSVTTAEALKEALATFRATPNLANLNAAKRAWLVAREPYGQTEVYRFRKSPIDSTDYTNENGPEGDINAWPLGEALIDYVKTGGDFDTDQVGVTGNGVDVNAAGSGIITATHAANNQADNIIGKTSITINSALLANTATMSDERDVVAGYHAIEFLLWGQDLDNNAAVTDGTNRTTAIKVNGGQNIATGGQRPLSDFISSATNDLPDRRHQYMEVAVDKLIADLKTVRDAWAPGASYRTAFTTISNEAQAKEKLTEIMHGMGTLTKGELAGERMKIGFVNNSQEDEHSCFSDNTHRDVWLNAEGVSNSYYGQYNGYDHDLDPATPNTSTRQVVSGYGIADYLEDSGATAVLALKTRFETALSETETNYKALDTSARTGKPFDVLIQAAERPSTDNPVRKTILSLNKQAGIIEELGTALGLGQVIDPDATGCSTDPDATDC